MPVDLQQFRGNFVEKISEMMAEKNHNSCYLMRETYVRIVNRLECLTYVEGAKKTCEDYRCIRKYDLFETRIEENTVKKLKKKGTDLIYVVFEDLFDIIHQEHLAVGHSWCEGHNL